MKALEKSSPPSPTTELPAPRVIHGVLDFESHGLERDEDSDRPPRLNPIERLLVPPRIVAQLEAFVCAECGFYELYLREPESMRFEELEGFQWVNSGRGGAPYR